VGEGFTLRGEGEEGCLRGRRVRAGSSLGYILWSLGYKGKLGFFSQ
jgi:hypothetical protein